MAYDLWSICARNFVYESDKLAEPLDRPLALLDLLDVLARPPRTNAAEELNGMIFIAAGHNLPRQTVTCKSMFGFNRDHLKFEKGP